MHPGLRQPSVNPHLRFSPRHPISGQERGAQTHLIPTPHLRFSFMPPLFYVGIIDKINQDIVGWFSAISRIWISDRGEPRRKYLSRRFNKRNTLSQRCIPRGYSLPLQAVPPFHPAPIKHQANPILTIQRRI